ncbi:MAG: molecular chaperone DnaJ [Acidimicrobiaceae bacterium]|jgi:molecular chaperone DnaJ|nr:molecular chaperone DnaJ [Acidimicrobiaceae bacterium]
MAPQREWFEKDYYKVLGVSDTATEKEITRAYRRLAKQYHPDANPGAEDRFKEVSAAYDVLGDGAKRKEYDEVRRLGPGAGGFRPFDDGGFTSFRVDDLGDLFGGLFGRGRNRSGPAPTGPRRGEDLEAQLHLAFTDAVNGLTTTVNVTSDAVCSACHGTGAAPGTSPVICPTCGGRGVNDENQGFFSFSQPCRTCGGTGMKVETPCRNCGGSGVERRPRQVKVRVPAGVDDGQRIRVKGRGGAGHNGGPAGDLYVVVSVAPHELFGRNGKDLTLTVPITFAEAALGATVKVPTLDSPVTLRIPPGTRSGRTFRVRGHGAPMATGAGDLLVTVEVTVPDQLDDDQRAAVERLAAAFPQSPRTHLGV